ncbi:MAG: hypothetical protein AB7T63_14895 [Planctomycetota bacterium]
MTTTTRRGATARGRARSSGPPIGVVLLLVAGIVAAVAWGVSRGGGGGEADTTTPAPRVSHRADDVEPMQGTPDEILAAFDALPPSDTGRMPGGFPYLRSAHRRKVARHASALRESIDRGNAFDEGLVRLELARDFREWAAIFKREADAGRVPEPLPR